MHKQTIYSFTARMRCLCGEDLQFGHPNHVPCICHRCRRFWTIAATATAEHEHERNPQAAIRSLVRYIQSGNTRDPESVRAILDAFEEDSDAQPRA